MTPGDADQQPVQNAQNAQLGLVPKLLTALPIAALCITGIVHSAHGPSRRPSLVDAAKAAAAPTPGPTSAPALEVAPTTQQPASVSIPAARPAGVTSAAASWSDIPTVAEVAYQRAATVIDSADPTCHLDWSLLAAIGKIESNHGRAGGSQLDANGVATPSIIGPALTGADGTTYVADTDGGALDGDTAVDRAIGPMQFLPGTWTTVAVDADGDGQRNPEDIDDASLAAAVYLCSGTEDLATAAGQSAAVFRYNHATSYVDTVLATAASYHSGFGAGLGVVNASYTGVSTREVLPVVDAAPAPKAKKRHKKKRPAGHATVVASAAKPAIAPTKQPTTPAPGSDPATDPTTGDQQPSTDPATDPTDPAVTPATAEQLTALCGDAIDQAFPDATDDARTAAIAACVDQLTGKPLPDAQDAVAALVATVPDTIDGLTPPADPDPTDPGSPVDPSTPVDPTPPEQVTP